MKIIFKINILLSLLMLSSLASADCHYVNGHSYESILVNFGTVIVQRDAPVGTVLSEVVPGSFGDDPVYQCTDPNTWTMSAVLGIFQSPSSIDGVYETNIDGVGIKIVSKAGSGFVFPYQGNMTASVTIHPPLFQLIKTKAVGTGNGNLSSGVLTYYEGADGIKFDDYSVGNNNIVSLACSIASPTIPAPLGDVSAANFTSVGHSPKSYDFTVGLECDAGANINVSLAGTQSTETSDNSVIGLTPVGGVATGLGVQILYNSTPLKLNENIALKESQGGQELLPFTARYYQTKSGVTPGSANATATLNITYQ